MTAAVRALGLSKRYGSKAALDRLDLTIPQGRVVGLVGPNGAGKTSLLNAAMGLISFEGELRVLNRDPRTERTLLLNDVGFISDVAVLPRWLIVERAVDFLEGVHPRFSRERCLGFLARTNVPLNARVRELSKGMVVQLHLALIMALDSSLLILDEPTLGLDLLYRKTFYETLMTDFHDREKTLIVATHQIEEIEPLLTDVVFLKAGRILLQGSTEEIARRFLHVEVRAADAPAARALAPLHERTLLGRTVFLFDGADADTLSRWGAVHPAPLADVFMALMKEERA